MNPYNFTPIEVLAIASGIAVGLMGVVELIAVTAIRIEGEIKKSKEK